MASSPRKLPTFSDSISPNSTMHDFNMERENRAPFPSICDIAEGLGPSLGGRWSYCRWKDPDVHHLYSPQAFIIFPTSSEVEECCGLNFTEVEANARSTWEDFSYQRRVEKSGFSPVLGPLRGNKSCRTVDVYCIDAHIWVGLPL